MYTEKDLERAFQAGNRLPISRNETVIKENFEQWVKKNKNK
jgi:hypothetical protein